MPVHSWDILRTLVESQAKERGEKLVSFLSPEQQTLYQEARALDLNQLSEDYKLKEVLSEVHPLWLIPLIEEFAEYDKHMIISVLDSDHYAALATHFSLPETPLDLPEIACHFIEKMLYTKLTHEHTVLPLSHLPADPLNALLQLSHEDLGKLTSHLGLYDLACDIGQIIDASLLSKIENTLSPQEAQFVLKRKRDMKPLKFPSMQLDAWDGKEETLRDMLQKRGLNRFAKALYKASDSLGWHVQRRLKPLQAGMMIDLADVTNAQANEILIEQVLNGIDDIKEES